MIFIDLSRSAPAVLNALEHSGRYLVRESDLEPELLVLVQIHVSYRSGCAECARGYAREARRSGEDGQRLRSLARSREAENGLYTARERTALAWAEALLVASGEHEWETVRRDAHTRFSERDLADLSLAVLSALAWSRMAVAVGWLPPQAMDPARRQPRSASAASGEPAGRDMRVLPLPRINGAWARHYLHFREGGAGKFPTEAQRFSDGRRARPARD